MTRSVHLWEANDWPEGWIVEYVEETTSTNIDLIDRVAAGDGVDRLVRVAGFQTAGRGRRDRNWVAPAGTNLLASMLFVDVPSDPTELMRRCGVAIVNAVQTFGIDAGLKWPNDVVVNDDKLAGMLAQRSAHGPVVVGFGLNIGWAPPGAARLGDYLPSEVLAAILDAFDRLPADIFELYRSALTTLGRRVRVEQQHGMFAGTAVDVERDGRLVVEADDGRRLVDVADVIHLRPDPSGSAK